MSIIKNDDESYTLKITNACFCNIMTKLIKHKIEGGEIFFKSEAYALSISKHSFLHSIKNGNEEKWGTPHKLRTTLLYKLDEEIHKVKFRYSNVMIPMLTLTHQNEDLIESLKVELANKGWGKKIVEENGTTNPIQFDQNTLPEKIEQFINQLEHAVVNSDIDLLMKLQKEPYIHELGTQDFFEELAAKIRINKQDNCEALSSCDGFCHNCLPNAPVKMFGEGRNKISFYYHFEANQPVEIHGCAYCKKHKVSSKYHEIDFFSTFYSAEERDPRLVENALIIAKALHTKKFEEVFHILDEKAYFDTNFDYRFYGRSKIIEILENLADEINYPNGKIKMAFISKDENYDIEDLHRYHGEPCIYVENGEEKEIIKLEFLGVNVISVSFLPFYKEVLGEVYDWIFVAGVGV